MARAARYAAAWKNKFNRYVKKGEKGIQIIAPAPIKEVEEREKIDKDTGLAVLFAVNCHAIPPFS